MSPPLGAFERVERCLAAVGQHRLMAEFRHRGLEQPALHRIVIDYEDGTCHERSVTLEPCVGRRLHGVWINLAQGSKQALQKSR